MDQILTQFGVQPILLAAQVVNFLVLLFILKKILYTPLLKVLEKRKKTIAQSLKNTEEIEQRLVKLSEEEEKRLQNALREGQKIVKQAEEAGLQIIEEAKVKAGEITEKTLQDVQTKLQLEREKLHQEIRRNLAEFMMIGLQKVTGKIITSKDQKKMVEDAVNEM